MLKDIIKSITEKIVELYPDIKIQSEDIKKGFDRPCFFIKLRSGRNYNIAPNFKTKSLSITIYYFASDPYENSIENLEVQEKLEDNFLGKLIVGETLIPINEVSSIVNDGVLQVSFDLDINKFVEDTSTKTSGELMEILELSVEEG